MIKKYINKLIEIYLDENANNIMITRSGTNNCTTKSSVRYLFKNMDNEIKELQSTIKQICTHKKVKYVESNIIPVYFGSLQVPTYYKKVCLLCGDVITTRNNKDKGFEKFKQAYEKQEEKIKAMKTELKELERLP